MVTSATSFRPQNPWNDVSIRGWDTPTETLWDAEASEDYDQPPHLRLQALQYLRASQRSLEVYTERFLQATQLSPDSSRAAVIFTGGRTAELEQRLASLGAYLSRKAGAVFGDDDSLSMLATLNEALTVKLDEFGVSARGLTLAKLTAAGFVDIGANVVSITPAGERFIVAIEEKWKTLQMTPPQES